MYGILFRFIMFVLIIYGIVSLFAPGGIWELQEHMHYKVSDREPSTASLVLIRLEGLVITGVAIFAMLQSCSGGGTY